MNSSFCLPLLSRYFDVPDVLSITVISQGRESSIAVIEGNFGKVILRIWNEEHGYMGMRKEGDIQGELAFMNFCRDSGIPVPLVFTSKQGSLYELTPSGRYFAVMEYVDGGSPHSWTSDMVTQVATTMAKMHNLVANFCFPAPRSWPGTVLEMTNERISLFESHAWDLGDASHEFTKQVIARFKNELASTELADLPQGPIHGDIMWENMKFKEGKLAGIFDFDDCRESYFIEDISKTLLFDFESPRHCLFGEDGQNVDVFIRSYESVRKLSDVELQLLPLFFTARFVYQVTSYYKKLAASKTNEDREMYALKIEAIIARFRQNSGFFDGNR